jgi:GNAT superfamily N-acetyltransferase
MGEDWRDLNMAREILVKDRRGRSLLFSQERSGDLVYFKLIFHKTCAAYANCRIEDEVLFLVDLFVEESCVVRNPSWIGLLFGRKILELNFREQGIGTQLLTTITAYARGKRLKQIEGRIVSKDQNSNPKLPGWYRKRGFTVENNNICKELRHSRDDSRFMPKP